MLHRSAEPAEPQAAAEVRVSRQAEASPQGPMARVVALHTAPAPATASTEESYGRFRAYVREKAPQLSDIINDAELHFSEDQGLSVRLAHRDSIMKTQLERPEKVVVLAEACKRAFGRTMRIRISVAPPAMSPESSPPSLEGEELDTAPAVVDMVSAAREASDESIRFAAAVGQDESPLGKPASYAEALERFPDFREAIDLVRRHFGSDPILFNGQRLN